MKKMDDVEITIDGQVLRVGKGITILEAAGIAGIHIPTLCYKKGISPTAVCRVCVVEIDGSDRLVGACHTPVHEGMVVQTRSAKVLNSRKAALELMLTAHTGPCLLDSRIGECELHQLASDVEVGTPRFALKEPRSYPVEEVSPYVRRDLSKCILCRRCVKACEEIAKKQIYSVAYRGFKSKIVVDCDAPLNKDECRDCGVCIDYCPTSALARPKGWIEKKESTLASKFFAPEERPASTRENLLRLLKSEQVTSGHLSRMAIERIAHELGITVSEVYGVATFYAFLSVRPLGENVIRICKSLPCYLKGSSMIVQAVKEAIGVSPGETSPDGKFSLELTNCIGACDRAPAMLVNHDVHGHLTPDGVAGILKAYSRHTVEETQCRKKE
jgi:NADH:ubiquinone oxidoreductase subunit E/NAD-dependent dihydropyrimidine dehydrogenase PreA subunit